MTVTPKFKVGQKVWTMLGTDVSSKPTEVEVKKIRITIESENREPHITCCFYKAPTDKDFSEWNENHFTDTKTELLNKLFPQ